MDIAPRTTKEIYEGILNPNLSVRYPPKGIHKIPEALAAFKRNEASDTVNPRTFTKKIGKKAFKDHIVKDVKKLNNKTMRTTLLCIVCSIVIFDSSSYSVLSLSRLLGSRVFFKRRKKRGVNRIPGDPKTTKRSCQLTLSKIKIPINEYVSKLETVESRHEKRRRRLLSSRLSESPVIDL